MSNDFVIEGIGNVVETKFGTKRGNDDGRGLPSLISPYLIIRLSKHLQKAAEKHDVGNWAKGSPFSRIIDGIYRHLMDYQLGLNKEDNLSAVAFGIMCLIHFEETGREIELNDLKRLYGFIEEKNTVDIYDDETNNDNASRINEVV